jgi:hypothetical protein
MCTPTHMEFKSQVRLFRCFGLHPAIYASLTAWHCFCLLLVTSLGLVRDMFKEPTYFFLKVATAALSWHFMAMSQ